ncbi:glycosyltransferase family 4 protein [Aeromicrobium wangtongii]|uniref:glycosyltransferase family 4 protein n=1 Tax=Aeromicrobium wangtongii TaxID=2969247 RepID=UPI0034E21DFE
MHIAVVGPVNVASLAPLLSGEDRRLALAQPSDNGSAPGRIVTALHERGHEVSVVTHRRGLEPLVLNGDRLSVHRVASRSNRAAQIGSRWASERSAMAEKIVQLSPDVTHSQWTYEAALACLDSGLPHVATVRDAPLTVIRFDPRPTRVVRASMAYEFRLRSRNSLLTAPSPYMARMWRRQMLDARQVAVVPNPVPNILHGPFERKSDFPLLVEVADEGRRKNVRGLLAAFVLVRAQLPTAQLVLIGDGLDISGETQRWAAAQGLASGVQFLGKVPSDEVHQWLARAWLHVHAAFEESFGNTLVEAFACGTAVLGGHRSAAVPWVLADGEAGVLANVASPQDLASAIVRVVQDRELLRRLGMAGRLRAENEFSPSSVAAKYESVYRSALEQKRS